jgi:hypothetical protein
MEQDTSDEAGYYRQIKAKDEVYSKFDRRHRRQGNDQRENWTVSLVSPEGWMQVMLEPTSSLWALPYLLNDKSDVGRAVCTSAYVRCSEDHGVALCGLVTSPAPSATAQPQ